jgi:dihydrodiol dehydrogenase / D-xylose 1-dehydrogenase (NADP)
MTDKVQWGILAPGGIARKFAEGLSALADAELAAVGSRSLERAEAFGRKWGARRFYGSYEELVADPELDAVYVSSPHVGHAEHSILALEAGKAVLCEKPFAINVAQARKVAETARRRRVFCMEAMWTRFLPTMVRLRELLAERAIGDPQMVMADFGFRCDGNPAGRLMNPTLGGGGLLDVGIYPISLAFMVLGPPERITGLATIGPTGVDEQSTVVMTHARGALSVSTSAVRTNTPQEAVVMGTLGRITLGQGWWNGKELTVHLPGETRRIEPPRVGNGYNYEAAEVGRCLREGRPESAVMGLDESLRIMEAVDEARRQWGLRYPME